MTTLLGSLAHASFLVQQRCSPTCSSNPQLPQSRGISPACSRQPAFHLLRGADRCSSARFAARAFSRQRWQQPQRRCGVLVQAAMFDSLSSNLEKAWDIVRKDGKLTKDNVKEPMREIRRALLDADVSLPVVRRFIAKVEEAALGVKVLKGIKPEQQLVKVVNDQLIELMGGQQQGLVEVKPGQTQVILMAGLQGVGKTTACGKLALYLKGQGKKVSMVATDVYRPAAIDQLVTLGQRIDVPVFEMGTDAKPDEIAAAGVKQAKRDGFDAVIVDTAGRLQIDERLMNELSAAKRAIKPTDTLLVVDAMTGQEAATLVRSFNEAAPITGAILTKMDGDSRGGAALSVNDVSGRPIKFIGSGEKLEALEPFYPDRIASRILGMGDILSLVEKAEQNIEEVDAQRMQQRLMENKFDFTDFLEQTKMMGKMGSMGAMMKMIPGMNKITDKQMAAAEKQMKEFESIIQSMTPGERVQPELLARTPSRRRRIARGCGRTEAEVAGLLTSFTAMRARMTDLSKTMRAMGGMPGMMSDDDMMSALNESMKVPAGKVRRKKPKGGRRGSRELAELRTATAAAGVGAKRGFG